MSSQDPIPPVRNYCVRELFKRNRIFCCRDEPISHRGNPCAAGTCSFESHVLCERDYSSGTKEVGWHSCQQIAPGRCSFNRNLKIGHEIGTSLWSRWQKSRRRCSLEFDGTKIAKCVPEVWKLRILGPGLIKYISCGSRKIRFLCCMSSKVQEFLIVHSCHSRTHRWKIDSAWIAGSRRYSIQLERVHISQRKFFRLFLNSQARTRCWRKNKQRWTTNSFLRTSQSDIWDCTRRSIDKRRLHETKNGTLSMQVETFSGLCLLGQFSQSTRRRITILADTVECHCCIQFCTIRMHLKGYFSKWRTIFSRDSRRLDLHQKLYSKSSWQMQQQQQQE